MMGGTVSRTVTRKLHEADWPTPFVAAAVAVHWTVVWPWANTEPDGGVQLTGTGLPAWSVAVTVYVTGEPHSPVTLPGQLIVGGQVPTVSTGAMAPTETLLRPLL